MVKTYLAIKFKEDYSDKEKIKSISDVLSDVGIETLVMVRDYEKWGEVLFTPKELMKKTFEAIDSAEILITEFSEKGVGLGIEAGYAFAKGKPIIVIAKEGSDISSTLRGISREVIFYNEVKEIGPKIKLVI
jgi:nucleoside 2-deoxyribosyltransferase